MTNWNQEWAETDIGRAYGDTFFRRATGELPEMESSVAYARRLLPTLRGGETVLDVGCGAGHYYRSLKRQAEVPFRYHGLDATAAYIEKGRLAFANDPAVSFEQGDIFSLPAADRSYHIASCCNVLLHLPSIAKPVAELVRVAQRLVLVRTLIGPKSYVVQDVAPSLDGRDFGDNGEPVAFHFLNIYSDAYVRRLLEQNPRVRSVSIEQDHDFRYDRVVDTGKVMNNAWNATRLVDGMQVSGMIILPWCWVWVELRD